ncbi:hypothetical protein Pmani_004468 [Petrolisthes manimaculis]|uniref:G-protein coupled receptors family 2 profile 2 domain-containing protein n=1 Tax=Petrolisthes manimaculis TaxID=1843537 RepID=A0AAE1UHI6_9EUCA|nr:hypothetical protein Pmani_004468 [Petrolisthes manimaculis]
MSNLLHSDKQTKWHTYEKENSQGAPVSLLNQATEYMVAMGKASGCEEEVKDRYAITEDKVHMEINRWKISELQKPSQSFYGPIYDHTKLRKIWEDPKETVTVSMGTHTDPRCKDRTTNLVVAIYDNVQIHTHLPLDLDEEMFNTKAPHLLDTRVSGLMAGTDPDWTKDGEVNPYSPHCDLNSPSLEVYYTLAHLVPMPARRTPQFHSEDEETEIYTRHCVRWNPFMGDKGGWDKTDCSVVYSSTYYTRCSCKQTGLYAVMAELREPKDTSDHPEWLLTVLLALYSISGLCLIFFILVVALVGVLKEQFHLLGLCLAVSVLGGSCAMIATLFDTVTEDRHDCATLGVVLHLCYLAAGAWMAMIGHAAFKCITSGIVDGQMKQYALLAGGLTSFCVGIPLCFYLHDLGDDPYCFISWEPEPKYFFFGPLVLFIGVALFCVGVIFLNLHTAALRNNPTMGDYRTFSIGSAILIIYFSITWIIGGINYMRVDLGFSMYTYFQILNSLMGVMLLLCIGVGSSRFRMAVAGQAKRRAEMFQNHVNKNNERERLQQQESPRRQDLAPTPPTRPVSRAFSADGARPITTDSDFPSRPSSAQIFLITCLPSNRWSGRGLDWRTEEKTDEQHINKTQVPLQLSHNALSTMYTVDEMTLRDTPIQSTR